MLSMKWLFDRVGRGLAVISVLAAAAGCDEEDGFSAEEWRLIEKLEPLKGDLPRNRFNHLDQDPALGKLGQMLFFDKDVAEAITVAGPSGTVGQTRRVACVNCHDTKYFADSRPTPGISHGRNWLGTNSGALVNLHWYDWTLWTGRFDSMVDHGAAVWGTSATPLAQARFLFRKYRAEWDATFPELPLDPRLGNPAPTEGGDPANVYPMTGGPKASPMAANGAFEAMPADAQEHIHQIRARLARIFDTYPRMLTTPDSPFQKYVRDRDYDQLNPMAKRGLRLFIGKAACSDCHIGPTLTDNKFHNIGALSQSMLPGSTTPLAPNRGRAATIPVLLQQLARTEADRAANPSAEKEWVYHGASRFSDDREHGEQRLLAVRQLDADHCLTRQTTMAAGSYALDCTEYDESIEGTFRTPSLVSVAETGPYFHGGLAATLEDVVRHYNRGGGEPGTFVGVKSPRLRPLGLTEAEIADLVEFLRSLTGVAPIDQKPRMDPMNLPSDWTQWNWGQDIAKAPLPPDPPPATP